MLYSLGHNINTDTIVPIRPTLSPNINTVTRFNISGAETGMFSDN